jgi:hypothetical protein
VASVIGQKLRSLNLSYPVLEDNHLERLQEAKALLLQEA